MWLVEVTVPQDQTVRLAVERVGLVEVETLVALEDQAVSEVILEVAEAGAELQ